MSSPTRLMALLFVLSSVWAAEPAKSPEPVFPYGAVYFRKSNPPPQDWERDHHTAAEVLLDWAHQDRWLRSDQPLVKARLHTGKDGTYLWLVNPTREPRPTRVSLSPRIGHFKGGREVWRNQAVAFDGSAISVLVGERNAAVIRLEEMR